MTSPQRRFPTKQVNRFRLSFAARLLAAIFLIIPATATSPTLADPGPQPIRIGLTRYLKGVSTVDISCSVDFTVTDTSKKRQKLATSAYVEPISVLATADGIVIKKTDGQSIASKCDIRIIPNKQDGLLTIAAATRAFSQYRGTLEIRRLSDKALLVINEVPLEDYLAGVLPAEMPSSFQKDALRAQAIAARTYSEKMRCRHADAGFDLCDSTHCQVYLGSGGEKPATSRAVTDTASLVARYKGELIWAVYSADCGGCTQGGDDEAIAHQVPYLKSIPDSNAADEPDFCSTNKTHQWSKTYTSQELETALNATLRPPIKGLKSVAFCEYDSSGRVRRIEITDDNGTRCISGTQFRKLCGTSVIRSTKMIVCATEDGGICFDGKGWGHGVGLCQWGAEGLGRPPWNYTCEQILKHYYAGIQIVKLQ